MTKGKKSAASKNLLQNQLPQNGQSNNSATAQPSYQYNPFLNSSAKRTIKACISNYVNVNNFVNKEKGAKTKLYMYTLTFPSMPKDSPKDLKRKALNSFLTKLRRDYNMSIYVWVQEYQKNGAIHFHLITDIPFSFIIVDKNGSIMYAEPFDHFYEAHSFLNNKGVKLGWNVYKKNNPVPDFNYDDSASAYSHMIEYNCDKVKRASNNGQVFIQSEIVKIWNDCLENHGYMSDFQQNNGHRNPPTVNKKVIDSPEKAAKYVTKYITKTGNSAANPNIPASDNGRLWGMSKELHCYNEIEIQVDQISRGFDKAKKEALAALYKVSDSSKFYVQEEYGFFCSGEYYKEEPILKLMLEIIKDRLYLLTT